MVASIRRDMAETARRRASKSSTGASISGASLKGMLAAATQAALELKEPRIDARTYRNVWGDRFSDDELRLLVVPKRTYDRRLAANEPLTVDETDKALRLARISIEAERVFGDGEKAARWLRRPNAGLHGKTPISLLRTDPGAKAVEEKLLQIDHGIMA